MLDPSSMIQFADRKRKALNPSWAPKRQSPKAAMPGTLKLKVRIPEDRSGNPESHKQKSVHVRQSLPARSERQSASTAGGRQLQRKRSTRGFGFGTWSSSGVESLGFKVQEAGFLAAESCTASLEIVVFH